VRVAGIDVLEEPRLAHLHVGFLPDFFGLYDALTVRQCLTHAAASHGVASGDIAARVESAARRLEIEFKLDARAGELSRGQRQRVAIGQVLVHAPGVLILDEPASGLDPEARHSLALLFRRMQAEGMTLVVSSHILAELDEYSTHMLVLREGRIVDNKLLSGSVQPGRRVRVELARAFEGLRARLEAIDGVQVLEADGSVATLRIAGGADEQAALLQRMVGAGLPIAGFGELREDLQATYLRTVKGGALS
jgi:ABC-2 type transport system ATP-binding protein